MKILKIIALTLLFLSLPTGVYGQKKSGNAASSVAIVQPDKYPNFNTKEAAIYWRMWITNQPFSQEDFSKVIDLCNIAYDYLNSEISYMLETSLTRPLRNLCIDQLDQGKTSEMTNFVRSFSTSLQSLATKQKFDEKNNAKIVVLLRNKKEFKRLTHLLHHT